MPSMMVSLLLCVPALYAREAKPQTASEQYRTLQREFEVALQKPTKAYEEARTDEERYQASEKWPWVVFAPRFLELAEKDPADPVSFDALIWVAANARVGHASDKAVDILINEYIASERLGPVLRRQDFGDGPATVRLYRAAIKKSPHREVRALATYKLARNLSGQSEYVRQLKRGTLSDTELQYRMSTVYRDYLNQLKQSDPDALAEEAEDLYRQIIETYADVEHPEGGTLGDRDKAELLELSNLGTGGPAPEIEGKDIDGKPMKLSDYRGKVVVLVWWATWCGPCMAMVPHERELIRRMEGKPFVLLGINGDEDEGRLKDAMKEKGIHWRSWDDGGPGGPISSRWNVRGWPTVYVLDPEGMIRYKNVREKGLDEAVDTLMKEAEMAAKP